MIKISILVFSAYYLCIGLFILAVPMVFYETSPGVELTGAYNMHFLRDVGLAMASSAVGLAWGAWVGVRSTAIIGATWPLFHGLFHVWIWVVRGFPLDHLMAIEAVAVIIPGILVFFLALKLKET